MTASKGKRGARAEQVRRCRVLPPDREAPRSARVRYFSPACSAPARWWRTSRPRPASTKGTIIAACISPRSEREHELRDASGAKPLVHASASSLQQHAHRDQRPAQPLARADEGQDEVKSRTAPVSGKKVTSIKLNPRASEDRIGPLGEVGAEHREDTARPAKGKRTTPVPDEAEHGERRAARPAVMRPGRCREHGLCEDTTRAAPGAQVRLLRGWTADR